MAGRAIYLFEQDDDLSLLPLSARRALDLAGQHLSLQGWRSLALSDRRTLSEMGAYEQVPVVAVLALVSQATPPPAPMEVAGDPPRDSLPDGLSGLLDPARSISIERWASLRSIDRYAIRHLSTPERQEKLRALLDELSAPRPTHLDDRGEARMVDVGAKPVTARRAVASALVAMSPATLTAITDGGAPKGDAFAAARIAGIQASKRTHELIPLCHALALSRVEVRFETRPERGEVLILVTADAIDRTGVEMEAMTAASVAALTLYDMVKGMERDVVIGPIQLERKEGGRTGVWQRGGQP